MTDPDLVRILDFAVESAHLAGSFTLGHFRAGTVAELKTDNTPVTVADRGAEELLRTRIAAAFPDHGIIGEEFGETPGRVPGRWILDPIDGTVSFISGVPLYSVLMAFEWAGEPVVGVLHLPALGETIYAARGLGCRCNGRPAHVSDVRELGKARLVLTSAKLMYRHGRGRQYERLLAACQLDRGWSDAYGYALLATGRAEVVLDPVMSVWDTAALVPIVTEAGGTVTDWAGRRTHTSQDVLATNGHLLQAVLNTLRG